MAIQYAVCHLQRGGSNGSGLSCHIERQTKDGKAFIPENADASRTHLNRELISFPEGVHNRNEAIQYRLRTAGLKRKVGKNQTTHICAILSGTHDQMMKLVESGKLDEWVEANLRWLKKTYGEENVVSCVLHMDEKTPHLHATIIPIVMTERKRREREGDSKYKVKGIAPRLCCDEVMSRFRLHQYQTTYGHEMKQFGLERGIVGSTAKHVANSEYYRQKVEEYQTQIEALLNDIATLTDEKEKAKSGAVAKFLNFFGAGELSQTKDELTKKEDELATLRKKVSILEQRQKDSDQQHKKEMFDLNKFCQSVIKERDHLADQNAVHCRTIRKMDLQLKAERQPDKHLIADTEIYAVGERGSILRLFGKYASVPFAISLTSEMNRGFDLGLEAQEIAAAYLPDILSTCFRWDEDLAESPDFRNTVVSIFLSLLDSVTTPTPSGGGGGGSSSSESRWDGKKPDESEQDYLRRTFIHAYSVASGSSRLRQKR